jgi:DNA-binding transcriptional LysR family regulator
MGCILSIWDGLEEFAAVARTGNFTKAANQLNVSTSHVSRRIQALENKLGVKLIARTTRTVRLTEVGIAYQRKVNDLIAATEEAQDAISGEVSELAGPLRVTAAGPFAEQNVIPELMRFVEDHPLLTLTVDFSNRYVDLIGEGYDFAIRYGALSDSSLIARKLCTRKLACAASATYLEQHGAPERPQDLRDHSCLVTTSDTWMFRDPESKDPLQIRVGGRFRFNSIPLMRTALERGLGIAYTAHENIQDLVAEGKVQLLLEDFEDADAARAHWIVYPDGRLLPRRVRLAIDFLLTAFEPKRR